MRRTVFFFVVLVAGCVTISPPMQDSDVPQRVSGLDYSGFDYSVRPADNLFAHVNGLWLKTVEVPADKSSYGAFTILADRSDAELREIVEEASASSVHEDPEWQKIGDFHRSFMDSARADNVGAAPLKDELDRIARITNRRELAGYLGFAQGLDTRTPLRIWVGQDSKNTSEYIVNFTQSGLGLPDRDYYLKPDDDSRALRDDYIAYIATLFRLAGIESSDADLVDLLAFETDIARAQWTRTEARNRDKTYNKVTREELLAKLAPIDMQAYLAAAGIDSEAAYNLRQPDYAERFAKIAAAIPLRTWRNYLRARLIDAAAPYLSSAFVSAHFDFNRKRLSGVEVIQPRWKRAVQTADDLMGEMIGKYYVQRYFKPESKARMDELVENLMAAFRSGIDELDWMSADTKREAHEKLEKFSIKIGYPSQWRDYTELEIRPDDLYGNVLRANRFAANRDIAKLGSPVDREEWLMSPQTVNAYYNSTMNEIVFPAAILQPPFFNVDADDAVNYGAIGAVIGHEISHGFDDQGRKSDGDGMLRNWWADKDSEEFSARANGLVAQYNAFEPLPGDFVNGEFTLGENIGDLSGLAVAYKAYMQSLGGAEGPRIDELSADQRFFMGWAQVWRRKYRDSELRRRLLIDPHAPSEFRVLGVLSNIDAFYQAFDVGPDDEMHLQEEKRVKIW